MLDRRQFLISAAMALPQTVAVRKPNVIYILCDEWRAQALSSAGDVNIKLPNLARLESEGVRFSRCYSANPLCGPSRAAIQTGKFPHAVKSPGNDVQLPLDEICVAQQMVKVGYKTGYIGKWHLDGEERPGFVPPGPRRRGYQYWAAVNRGETFFDAVYFGDTGEPISTTGFEPDFQTDLAMEFMEKNKANPFYLVLSFVPPHAPFTPPPRHAKTYRAEGIALRENVPAASEAKAKKDHAGFYGLCSAVDDNIGRLLKKLDDLKLTEDTLVIFTADHGGMLESHGLVGKNVPYEESVGIPFLVRYPRKIKPRAEDDLLISNVDHMPTILGFCGAEIPADVHGRDLSEQMMSGEGNRPESIYSEGLLFEDGEWRMIVRGFDKMVIGRDMKVTHLYNLGQDPFELTNLANSRASAVLQDGLMALLKRWMIRTGDRVPYLQPRRRA